MRPNLIPILSLSAITITSLTAAGSVLFLRSSSPDNFKNELHQFAQEQDLSVFTERSSGDTEPLPFLLSLRFPPNPVKPSAHGFSDGSTLFGIRDEAGFFHVVAQRRRYRVCHVVLKNHSARPETILALRRHLNARLDGLRVEIEKSINQVPPPAVARRPARETSG